jgi:hypothetical protein
MHGVKCWGVTRQFCDVHATEWKRHCTFNLYRCGDLNYNKINYRLEFTKFLFIKKLNLKCPICIGGYPKIKTDNVNKSVTVSSL